MCSAEAEMGDRLATIDVAKNWGLYTFWKDGAGSPSNTTWPGQRPTFVPSGILIRPAVWPQQTWAENWVYSRKITEIVHIGRTELKWS